MKPGDLVKLVPPGPSDIMTVLQARDIKDQTDEGWKFCTAGRQQILDVDVFHPRKGIRTYRSSDLEIVSDDHTSVEHATLTALAFAGSCSSSDDRGCGS